MLYCILHSLLILPFLYSHLQARSQRAKKDNPGCPTLCGFFLFFFFYLFLAVLGLRFCARSLHSCGKRGLLFIAVRGPLTIAASLVAEHGLQTRRLSSCDSRAQSLRGVWDPPRPGLAPVSLAPAGRLPATAPPGKPHPLVLKTTAEPLQSLSCYLKSVGKGIARTDFVTF